MNRVIKKIGRNILVFRLTLVLFTFLPFRQSFAQFTPPEVLSFPDLQQEVDARFTNQNLSLIYPPEVSYTAHQGIFTYSEGFDTNLLAGLPAQAGDGYQTRRVSVRENSGLPLTRSWMDVGGQPFTNTPVSGSYDPTNWVLDHFTPPSYLTGTNLDAWIQGLLLARQTLTIDLMSTNDLPAFLIALTNSASSGGTSALSSNDIGALQVHLSGDKTSMNLVLQAPTNVQDLGVYQTDDLINPFPWQFLTELPHDTDPILISQPLTETQSILTIANHSLDSDGDGLLDALELLLIGTQVNTNDSDSDGVSDYDEVMIYNSSPTNSDTDADTLLDAAELFTWFSNPLNADTDGDQLQDGWEVAHSIDLLDDGRTNISAGADGDPDGDGMRNLAEQGFVTDPNDADSDNDGYIDAQENENGSSVADYWDPSNHTNESSCSANWTNAEDYLLLEVDITRIDSFPPDPPPSQLDVYDPQGSPPRRIHRFQSGTSNHFLILKKGKDYTLDYQGYSSGRTTLAPIAGTTNVHPQTTFKNSTNLPLAFVVGDDEGVFAVYHEHGANIILHNSSFTCDDFESEPIPLPIPKLPAGGGDEAILYVPSIDLDESGVTNCVDERKKELDPGIFIGLNNDDDNTNGVSDLLESDLEEADDDLVELMLTYAPESLEVGEIRLEAPQGTNLIQVWSNDLKKGQISLPAAWSPTNYPSTVYLEGIAGSSSNRDVELVLSYTIEETDCYETPFSMAISNQVNVSVHKAVMTRPDDQASTRYFHYHFDAATPGVCEVACNVSIPPTSTELKERLLGKVKWTAEEITGSTLSWENGEDENGVGVYDLPGDDWRENAIYTTLPSDNEAFGEITVTVEEDLFGFLQTGKAKIFFDRDAKNHPGAGSGTTPNWFYYWPQGAVGGGLDDFEYGGTTTTLRGKYVESTDTLYVYSATPDENIDYSVTHKTNSSLQFTIGVDAVGIDAVAGTVVHEKHHQWIHQNWSTLPDMDGDGIPDSEENKPPYYFDKNDPDSYSLASVINPIYSTYGDNEFLCRVEEQNFIADSSKDWAHPGKQWTGGITEYQE